VTAVALPEATFQARVIGIADLYGWMSYHTHDSRRSGKGWPDLALAHPRAGRFLVRELKTARGTVSPEQEAWLAALTAAGVDAGVWRPADLASGLITATLDVGAARWSEEGSGRH
jgi:hypothetical protein